MKAIEFIIEQAEKKGFCDVGICSTEPFDFLRPKLEDTQELLKGFVERDIEKRINPQVTMVEAKSIIVFAKSYNKKIAFPMDGLPRGYISMGAVGEDYHRFMNRELRGLAEIMKQEWGGEYLCFSDTGPLCDRALALRSGMGYLGRNGSVITDRGGGMTFLGYMLTTLKLPAGKTQDKVCDSQCKKCEKSCPTGAIQENTFQIEKCISYLTQLKRNLSLEESQLIGNNLYGCDVCQRVCPKTKAGEEKLSDIHEAMPRLEEILSSSNNEFHKKYGDTAMSWRGNRVIKRNALAALGNIKHERSLDILMEYVCHENDFLRYAAINGVRSLKNTKSRKVLEMLYLQEKNEEIREVIRNGLLEF